MLSVTIGRTRVGAQFCLIPPLRLFPETKTLIWLLLSGAQGQGKGQGQGRPLGLGPGSGGGDHGILGRISGVLPTEFPSTVLETHTIIVPWVV